MDTRREAQHAINSQLATMSDREIYLTLRTLMYAVDRARQEKLLSFDADISSRECIDVFIAKKLYSKMISTMAFPISMYGLDAETHYEMMYLIVLKHASANPKSFVAEWLDRPFDDTLSRIKAEVTTQRLVMDFSALLVFSRYGKYDHMLFMLLDNSKESQRLLFLMKREFKDQFDVNEYNNYMARYQKRLESLPKTPFLNAFFSRVCNVSSGAKELKQPSQSDSLPDLMALVLKNK